MNVEGYITPCGLGGGSQLACDSAAISLVHVISPPKTEEIRAKIL